MTQPAVSPAGQRIYDRVAAYHDGDEAGGWMLLYLCEALAGMFSRSIEALKYDTDAPLGSGDRRMLDTDRAPAWALPWLAQWYGVSLPASYTEAQQRAVIKAAPQMRRGTPAAIAAAVKVVLDGDNPTVRIIERADEDPYHFAVITLVSQTPDPDLVEAAIRSQKPAGLTFEHILSDSPLIDEGTLTIDDVTATIDDATLGDVT